MIYSQERPSLEAANNVIVKRCFYAYEYATSYLTSTSKVYDIGCADGYGTSYLSGFCGQITGLDYSKATVDIARSQFRHISNMTFEEASVPPLPIESETADVITAFQFIEHIHQRTEFVADVKRVLKPGGTFICTTLNSKKSLARNPYHVHEYTFAEMKEEISRSFDEFTLLGLHGNEKVNAYYHENQKWVRSILRYDVLGIHKILPSGLLQVPYNFITSIMRKNLLKENKSVTTIGTNDFYLSPDNLDEALDIFVVARKKA